MKSSMTTTSHTGMIKCCEDSMWPLKIKLQTHENTYYQIPQPNPLDAIKFRMEQLNMSESELSEILGARSRKSEILSGKRKLSLSMIRKLHAKLHISAQTLIQEY
ncbi:MAG: HTH-type transcriptional regulator/antitoxin HigA [Algoriphagus sp.]|jgi:HTH-type transcriptional regulator/antitoxin HigA